jgi:hypothetical protein
MQFSKTTAPPFTQQLELLSWFEEHEGELHHLPWPAQSPDLKWSVLETRVRNRFPPQTSLKQLEDVLQEEWYKIPRDCSELVRVHSKDRGCNEGNTNKEMSTVAVISSISTHNICNDPALAATQCADMTHALFTGSTTESMRICQH